MSDPKKIILGRADRNSLAAGAPKLPSLPTSFGTDPKQMIGAIKEILEVREGQRGSKLDKSLTWRDLFEQGVIALNIDGQAFYNPPGGGIVPGPANGGSIDSTPPPAPTGLEAVGAVATVILRWDAPPANVAYTEIWRSATNDLGTATKIGTSTSTLYNDVVGSSQVYYYWIRWVTRFPTTGPFNKTEGTEGRTGLDASYILELLAANPPAGVNYNPLLWVNDNPDLEINGVPVPVGTYMQQAYIANGSIGRLQVGLAAIDDARVANLSAEKITAGDIAADRMKANIVQAAQGQFATLSALSAYLGTVLLNSGGWLKTEGVVDYNVGTGLYMDATLFRVGNGTQGLWWDGNQLYIKGNLDTSGNAAIHGTFTSGTFTGMANPAGSYGAYVGPEGAVIGAIDGSGAYSTELVVDRVNNNVSIYAPTCQIVGGPWYIQSNGQALFTYLTVNGDGYLQGNLQVHGRITEDNPKLSHVQMGMTASGGGSGLYGTTFTTDGPCFVIVTGRIISGSGSWVATISAGPVDASNYYTNFLARDASNFYTNDSTNFPVNSGSAQNIVYLNGPGVTYYLNIFGYSDASIEVEAECTFIYIKA
jgi:hypothetical protein